MKIATFQAFLQFNVHTLYCIKMSTNSFELNTHLYVPKGFLKVRAFGESIEMHYL